LAPPSLNIHFSAFLSHYFIKKNVSWQLFQWGYLDEAAVRDDSRTEGAIQRLEIIVSLEESKRQGLAGCTVVSFRGKMFI